LTEYNFDPKSNDDRNNNNNSSYLDHYHDELHFGQDMIRVGYEISQDDDEI